MNKDWPQPEPFRIKMVEPIEKKSRSEREKAIERAGYNVFSLKSEDVFIDLLTDSGTSAMSDRQWGALMQGDEAYAGSRSYLRLQQTIEGLLGFRYVLPTHQGRAAENILMTMLVNEGDRVPGNMHFDTTEGHILLQKARPVNLLRDEGYKIHSEDPFKGNIDIDRLKRELEQHSEKVPFVLLTVTCNNNGGQPVSMDNIRQASEIARSHQVPLFFDAARFAENAFFIKKRDPDYADWSIEEIVGEMFSWADGCTMSAKKDGLVNIGGFLAFRDEKFYEQAIKWQIPFEGFVTYGGLAGRDLMALSEGLKEVTNTDYLSHRVGQVRYLAEQLKKREVPVIWPPGGHGVYIDAQEFFPHIPPSEFPGQALVVELYREGGVRGVELGSLAFAHADPETGEVVHPKMELVRLAVPRRVYTYSHLDWVAETVAEVFERREELKGYRVTYEAPVLRHFTAELEPLD